jgi:hypothetical protein
MAPDTTMAPGTSVDGTDDSVGDDNGTDNSVENESDDDNGTDNSVENESDDDNGTDTTVAGTATSIEDDADDDADDAAEHTSSTIVGAPDSTAVTVTTADSHGGKGNGGGSDD